MYIADPQVHKVYYVNTVGTISTFAGTGTAGSGTAGSATDGVATLQTLNSPQGIAVDSTGTTPSMAIVMEYISEGD